MIYENLEVLRQRVFEVTKRKAPIRFTIFEDTSEFIRIEVGDILRLSGNDYFVLGHAREGRFGIDDQPEFWVKSVLDLQTAERKIIKLVFQESFKSHIGFVEFNCFRNSEKEADILSKMRCNRHFMQGTSARDKAGNLVRIIDFVPGPSLYDYLRRMEMTHEFYYQQKLKEVMLPMIEAIAAIASLHKLGLNHGDIRADHLIVKNRKDTYVWIDFDYDVREPAYDLFCLGNVLLQVVGKGRHSLHDIRLSQADYPHWTETLNANDMSLMFQHRVSNLRKLFPYISADLNTILTRFSLNAADAYHSVDALLADLQSLFPKRSNRDIL